MTVLAPPLEAPSLGLRTRLALVVMVTLVGGALPAYKLAEESFGPATTNAMRFVIAAAMLCFVARGTLASARGRLRELLVLGMFGIGLMAVLMGFGVDGATATIGSIVIGLEPIGVAVAGIALAGDARSTRVMIALAVGFVGALAASGALSEPIDSVPVLAIGLLLGTVVAFSIYTSQVRRIAAGVDALAVAAVTQLGAVILVVPACLVDIADRGMVRGSITPEAVGAVLFLGFGSGVAYLLLCVVLSKQPASRLAVVLYLVPVIGVVLSWLAVGERLHLRDAIGGAIVLAAIAISEGRGRLAS